MELPSGSLAASAEIQNDLRLLLLLGGGGSKEEGRVERGLVAQGEKVG